MASGPVLMFCAPGLIFGRTEGVGSRFHVLRSRTRFPWYRGVGSCFFILRSQTHFRHVTRASGPVLMFYAPGLVFDGTEGIGSRLNVLRGWTLFWRYRGRRVPFSTPRVVFGDTEVVGSHFHVFGAQTHFRRYNGRRLLFSCFALPDSFPEVSRASGPVFMFCAPVLVFGDTEGVVSRFHVLRS
jgi:hypothetical protein